MKLIQLSKTLEHGLLFAFFLLQFVCAKPLLFKKDPVAASKAAWANTLRATTRNQLHTVGEIRSEELKSAVFPERDLASSVWTKIVGLDKHINQSSLHKHFHQSALGVSSGQVLCSVCKLVLTLLHVGFTSEWSEDKIEAEARTVCIMLRQEDQRVCDGIVHMFKAEVLTVFGNLVVNPNEVCGFFLGPQCAQTYNPFSSWNITLPDTIKPPVVPPTLPQPDSPTLRVLHLTDIHMDTFYAPDTKAVCHEPLCCRADDGNIGPFPSGAGRYGDYRDCDTPIWTLHGLFTHLQTQQFDYILWTGDLPAHNIWNQTRADQEQILYNLTALLDKYFPGKPIFPALGNHESSPVNSFPPHNIDGGQSISWLYDALAESWGSWLPEDALETVRKGAYYTVTPFPGFRIISLNMNACNNMNWWLYLNTTDPDHQLAWLITVLQNSEDAQEKVHIIGHIPPGEDDCLEMWSRNYYKIVDRYESTITGQFFGHTHFDHVEVFYDLETLKRPTSVAYISPSVTPFSGLNMGYRIFTVDGNHRNSSLAVLDHETYILNLTAANLATTSPTWELEYAAKAQYGMKSLFPSDWEDFIGRMETNDQLLQQYYLYYYKSNVNGPCDTSCKQELVCKARTARSGSASDFCDASKARRKQKKMC